MTNCATLTEERSTGAIPTGLTASFANDGPRQAPASQANPRLAGMPGRETRR